MKFLRATTILGALAVLSACDATGSGKSTGKDSNLVPGQTENNTTPGQTQTTTGSSAVQLFGSQGQATDSTTKALKNVGGRLDEGARQNLLSANATYKSELGTDPNDHAAQFGVAVTSLSLKMDELSGSIQSMYDRGLKIGGLDAGSMFQATPTSLLQNQVFATRTVAKPANAPAISELQTLLDEQLLPTVDSAIGFLTSCWNDPAFSYRFAVRIGDKQDSLTIGRADIGFALAGLRTARAYFTWLLAQNVDCNFPGQGFATDYAWIDTLRNINGNVGPATASQRTAYSNLQTLLTAGSKFLTIRDGHQAKVNAIPQELLDIADLVKQAGDHSALHQLDFSQGLAQLKPTENANLAKVMDSVKYYLGGMRSFVRAPSTRTQYTDSVCTWNDAGFQESYSCAGHEVLAEYPGYTVRMDISKLITQADHKVFLPKFVWNSVSSWKTKGPFSLKKGSVETAALDFENLDIQNPTDLDSYIEWADPSFGGAFAFTSTLDVLKQFEAMNEKPVATHALAPISIVF